MHIVHMQIFGLIRMHFGTGIQTVPNERSVSGVITIFAVLTHDRID